jgi:hypothetical protein
MKAATYPRCSGNELCADVHDPNVWHLLDDEKRTKTY